MGRLWFAFVFAIFSASVSVAAPRTMTYEGYLTDASDVPISGMVTLQFQIYGVSASNSGSTNCLLYTETQSSLSVTSGHISTSIGTGSASFPGGLTLLDQVFDNQASIAGSGCTFAGNATDARRMLRVSVNGTAMGTTELASAPRAFQANNSTTLNGLLSTDFVQTSTVPTCSGGMVLTFNGSSFSCVAGGGGSGLTSLNGLTSSSQTFATPVASGTAMGWTSSSTSHTLNIPMASTTAVTAGLLSKTDYDAFNAKLGTSSTFSGDVSGTSSTMSVDRIRGTGVSFTTLTAGHALRYNGTNWVNANFGIADISGLSSALGDKIDSAAIQGQNTVLAGPSSGSGAPSFRALVAADLPAAPYDASYFRNGLNNFGSASSLGNQGSFDLSFHTNNQARMTIHANGSIGIGTNLPSYPLDLWASGMRIRDFSSENPSLFLQNSSQTWRIVNNMSSGNSLVFFDATSGFSRMLIDTSGNVGIGTNSPSSRLEVNGTAAVNASTEAAPAYVSSSSAYAIPDSGSNIRRITLTANTTITLPSFTTTGKVWTLTVFVKQDGTGSRNLTWAFPGGDSVLWDASATAPTVNPTINKLTIYQFTKAGDETIWYGSMVWRQF